MEAISYTHSYPLENSEESIRLQNQHAVIKDAMGSLVLAPVDLGATPLRILDSGTADGMSRSVLFLIHLISLPYMLTASETGVWIRDLASSTAPVSHEFYGTDINPAEFPSEAPANTIYQAQDITKPWPEDWKEKFDFVHQRVVLVGAGPHQKAAVKSLGSLVKPGGWIQLIEATNNLPDGSGPEMHAFVKLMNGIFVSMGASLEMTQDLPRWLEQDGFVGIQTCMVDFKVGAQNPVADLARRGTFSMTTACKNLAQWGKCECCFHLLAVGFIPRLC